MHILPVHASCVPQCLCPLCTLFLCVPYACASCLCLCNSCVTPCMAAVRPMCLLCPLTLGVCHLCQESIPHCLME